MARTGQIVMLRGQTALAPGQSEFPDPSYLTEAVA
jgi:hypothetical protein